MWTTDLIEVKPNVFEAHVIPVGDTINHTIVNCECRPKITKDYDGTIVTHNAQDGRKEND